MLRVGDGLHFRQQAFGREIGGTGNQGGDNSHRKTSGRLPEPELSRGGARIGTLPWRGVSAEASRSTGHHPDLDAVDGFARLPVDGMTEEVPARA